MKKTILALAAAATIAASTLAPTSADARGGFLPGLLGGIVVGAIVGSAIASHPGYYRYDDYDEYAGPNCYWARRAWRDEDGNVHYSRPRKFCD
jgi:hypothetical protein